MYMHMKKQYIIFAVVVAVLAVALVFVFTMLQQQKSANAELQELAELDKLEMEDQYRQFDLQYGELQKQLKNDSLIAQIEEERRHTQELLEELERTKATDAAEITRLKKEITSLRKVLQSYIMQVDSLNRLNETLVAENAEMKEQVTEANTQISSLRTQASTLKDKVEIAAQLDATGFWVSPQNKRGKDEKKAKNVKKLAFGFTIVKNVTAQNGERVVYARILKPDNTIPTSLIFGNESAGLPAEFAGVGDPVRIVHLDTVDSLNLPSAAAIGIFYFTAGRFG